MSIDPQIVLESALPAIAFLVSYLIQQAHWSDRANTSVAGATVILAAVASVFVQHKLTSNVLGDFLLVASVAAGLQANALAPLAQWLRDNVPTKSTPPTQPPTPTIARASLLQTGQTWTATNAVQPTIKKPDAPQG